jgi:hypothetical protein
MERFWIDIWLTAKSIFGVLLDTNILLTSLIAALILVIIFAILSFLIDRKTKEEFQYLSIVMVAEWYQEEMKKRGVDPFKKDNFFVYLGEIPNMRGHGVFLGHESGKVYSGFHIEDFRLPTEDEF